MAARGRGASRRSRRDAAASSDMRLQRARLSSRSDERVPRRAPLYKSSWAVLSEIVRRPRAITIRRHDPGDPPGADPDARARRARASIRPRAVAPPPRPRLRRGSIRPRSRRRSQTRSSTRISSGRAGARVRLRADLPAFARRARRRPLLRVLLPELRRRAAVGARDPVERGLRRHVGSGGTRGCQDVRADPRRSEEGGGRGTDAGAVPARGTGPGVQVHGRSRGSRVGEAGGGVLRPDWLRAVAVQDRQAKTTWTYTPALFADELAEVRRATGLGRVHVVAHGWGGMLALDHVLGGNGVDGAAGDRRAAAAASRPSRRSPSSRFPRRTPG